MKPAMRFTLVALFCIAAVAFANRATEVPLGSNTITYQHTVYRFEDDTTIFTYLVNTGSDLSHFIISTECAPAGGLAAGQDWVDHTTNPDPFTGKYGFLYPLGIDAGTVNLPVTLTFHGDVSYAATSYVVKSSNHFSVGTDIYGPVCGATYNPKNPAGCASTPADANITCDNPLAHGKGSADSQDIFEGRCPGDYELHNNYRTLVSSYGGYSECTQELFVTDTAAPEIVGLLANESHIVLKCGATAPAAPTLHAVDTCDPNPLLPHACEETSQGSCPSNTFLLRTWTATDHCGNSKCVTQTIAWVDDTAPVLHGVPANEHHECTADHNLPAVPVVTATDDCDCWKDPLHPVSATPKRISGECDNTYTFAVTYNAEDCCGNSASKTWTYTVVDTTPPTIEYSDPTYIPGKTYECSNLPQVPEVTVTDVCTSHTIVPFHNVTRVDGSCPYAYELVYFWSATDDCGNTKTKTETVHVRDNTAPQFVLSSLPANVTVECGNIPAPADVKANDNCELASLVPSETAFPGHCANEQVIIRTWVATDKCGNSVSHTQEIIVVDTTATKFNNVPTVGPFKCAADVPPLLPAPAGLTWGPDPKGCSNDADLTASELVLPGSCDNKKTIIRTYTLTDCSGNTDSVNITIVVNDDVNPTFSDVPVDVTVECNNVPARQDPHFHDNCDCPTSADCRPINFNEARTNGSCPNQYTLTRTWTATDSCGNPVSATQVINVIQTSKPTISDIPADVTVQCDAIPARPAVTGHTNCGTFTITTPADDKLPGSCDNQYTIKRHWHIQDECGNFNDYTQTINVIDTTFPTLTGVPDDETVSCANIPTPPDVCASDNCLGVTVDFVQTRTDQTCDADGVFYKLVRTWTATDACGNTVSKSQTIKVTDTINPTFTGTPQNLDQDCASVSFPADPQPADSCTAFTLTPHHYRVDGSCDDSYVLHRNFKATDACGNFAWWNYTITVTDTHAPQLHGTPQDADVTCILPGPAAVTATDDCDQTPTLVGPNDVNVTVKCKFDFTTKRTWTATDNCGNPTSYTQTIVVRDDQKPTWTSPDPQNGNAECVVPAPPTLTATGFCGDTATVTRNDVRANGSCVYDFTLTRTWTATDVCNNFDTKQQVITVKDVTAPTVTGVPADVTVDCAPPTPAEVCLEDNCDGVNGHFEQTVSDQTCPNSYTLTRTWTATDLCGHSTSKTQVITVRDITKPVFTTANPGDSSVSCFNGAINAPTATDNCGAVPTITNHTWVEPGDCPYHYKVHVAFKATDACSNSEWWNYTITVGDSSNPTVQWVPAPPQDESFTCGAVPAAPTPIVGDNCGGATFTGPTDTEISRTCAHNYVIERKWVFSDACGNSFPVIVHLTSYDAANPTFDNAPGDRTLKCNEPVPAYNVTGKDSCGHSATVTGPTGGPLSGSCNDAYPIVRTWTVTDDCGLSTSHTQTITVEDNEAPTIVAPQVPSTVADACVVAPPGTPTVTDNCDPAPFVSSNQTEKDRTCPYRVTAVNHFYAHDRCGNPSSLDQPIVYTWSKLPSLFNTPGSTTVECDAVPAPAVVSGADGCGLPKTPVYVQTRTNGSCPNAYTLTRTWTVTDDCQVSNSYTQTINVVDTTLPELCGVPASITVQCGFVPTPPTVTAKDSCSGVKLEFNEVKIPGSNCCDYKLERTWTATDACGNVREGKQIITVVDKIPPVIVVPPNINCAECPFTLDNVTIEAHKPALAHGYCGLPDWPATACYDNVQHQSIVVVDGMNLHYGQSTFVTWFNGEAHLEMTLLDTNNVEYLLQAVLSNATGKPAGYSPALELNANCYPAQADPTLWSYYPHITGTLSGNGKSYQITDSANPSQVGLGADGRSLSWGATVYLHYENSNVGSASDATLRLSLIADGVGTCYFNHTELPHFECNDPIPAVLNTTIIPGSCPSSYTILREWCATDESGNKACGTQTITVCDTTAPEISGVPPTISVSCDAPIPVANVSSADACDNPPSLNYTDVKTPGSCPGNYDILRTYTSVDACGNVAYKPEQIHVYDHVAPVLTVPATITVQCDAVPPFAPANATDNCGISALQPLHVDQANAAGPQVCAQSYTKERVFTATDECGNSVSESAYIIVRDDNNPTISNVPDAATLECKAPVPASNPTASDPCGGDLTPRIVATPVTQNTNCPNLYSTTVTYTVQDYCGNNAEPKTWTYGYIDTTNPTWNQAMPANVTVQCDQIPAVPTISAGDACNYANTSYSTWQVGPANGDCAHNYVIFRKWVATDCAGNSISHTQAITVIDTTNPVITPGTVADVTATCKAVPNPPDFCVTDNCDGVNAVWTDVRTNSNGQPNSCDQYVRNRTLVATDDCGNTASVSYTVTVNDQTAPTCGQTPDYNSECSSFQAPPRPLCSDDCSSANVELVYSSEAGPQNCPQSIVHHYDYKATDDCGNVAWSNTTVTQFDATKPVLHNIPDGETYECGTPEPADPVTATDNCETPTVHRSTVRSPEPQVCQGVYTLTRSWYATDSCGNQSPTETRVWNFVDTTKPQFAQPMPANTTVQCDQVPPAAVVTGTDNCDTDPDITLNQWNETGSCDGSYTVFRKWTIKDCSGNFDTYVQAITVIDTTLPTLTQAPANSEEVCHQVPAPPAICASDNCDGVNLDYTQTRTNKPGSLATCQDQFSLNRTWVATDSCGNSVSTSYTITVNDVTPPTCQPSSITPTSYSCENRANTAPSRPQCSDDCSTVNYEEHPVHVPGSCAYNYVDYFNFKATDDCGNSVWVNTSVEIYDNTQPHFITTPADATVECSAIPAREDPTWGDNCGTVTLDSYTEVPAVAPAGCKNYEIKRTWVIKDECGNTNTHVQTLTVQDTQKPQWVLPLPTDKTFQCDEVYPDPTLSATDNCGTPVTVRTITTVPGSCNNQYDKVYTWNTTDDCGNFDTYSVTYHIIDTEKPTFNVIPPAQISATCDNVPKPDDVCCSDSCDGVKLDFVQTRTDMGCSSRYSLNRTWICTDNCGNVATTTQIVIVTDTNKPTFNQIPVGTKSYECVHTDSQVVLTANDTCTGANVNMTETLVPGECAHNYTVVRKWQAMDDCGNEDWVYQNVSVQDTLPPHVDQSNISCYSVNNYLKDQVVVYNLTQEGNVFTTGDACSGTVSPTDALPRPLSPFNYPPSTDAPATTIEYYSCSSDLDAWFGNGCNYDGSLDQLTLEADMDPINNKTGRLYTIVVKVTDQCGHSVFGSHQILIPFDQFSASLRGLPADVNCVVAPGSCDENCACQTVDHFCTAGSDFGSLSGSQSFANGNTEFKYVLSASTTSAAAQLVQIAVDLTKYEIVSTNPAGAELGYQFGSALYGISWKNFPAGTTQFSFTVAGTVSTVGPVSYLLGVGLDTNDAKPANYPTCSDVRTVNGPVAAPSFTGANGDISGKVVISGARFGVTRAFNFPLADVVVGLRNVGSNSFLRKATTDATGSYTFHDVDATGKEVIIVEDGLLRSGGQITKFRNSKSFLRATVNIIFGQPTYGVAQSASDPIFKLLLDDEATPKYSRQQNNNDFEGNSKPWYYWLHQKDGLGASDFNSAEWAAINAQASSICTTFSGTGNTIENQLTGAAYNIAAGFGIFEPYDEVQTWMFAFAQHVHCGGAADPVDEAIALKFAQRINDADDNDRS